MTIILIEANPFEEMPASRFLEIAQSSDPDRAGLNRAHGGVASNGFRMHICKDINGECDCGDEKIHKTMNEAIDKVYAESKFVFAISRPLLIEALAGIPEGEHAGEIYFYSAGLTKPVAIASKGCSRAALIMPIVGMEDNPLLIPRIREPIKE
jgi:hypothetical protein